MALDDSAYSSAEAVAAMTKHLLEGELTFGVSTRPSLDEVESFINEVSGILNLVLQGKGLEVPITATSGARACSVWVRSKAVAFVELTQRGEGFGEEEGSRYAAFWNLFGDAQDFVEGLIDGLKAEGATVTEPTSEGLMFTGLSVRSLRSDPTDTTLAQPKFWRGQFKS